MFGVRWNVRTFDQPPNEFVCSKVALCEGHPGLVFLPCTKNEPRCSCHRCDWCLALISTCFILCRLLFVQHCSFSLAALVLCEAQKLSHALHQMFKAYNNPFSSFLVDVHRLCGAASCTPAIRIDMSIFWSQSCLSRHNLQTKCASASIACACLFFSPFAPPPNDRLAISLRYYSFSMAPATHLVQVTRATECASKNNHMD